MADRRGLVMFTDDDAKHFLAVVQTQAGIQAFIRKAAEVLAQAGFASKKAIGDNPEFAIRRWSRLMADEAVRLCKEKATADYIEQRAKQIEDKTQ